MTLQQLWDKLVATAGAQDQVIAGVYAPYIAELSDDLGDLYEPQEFPKWVNGQVVHTADEERALTGEPEAIEPSTPADAAPEGDGEGKPVETEPPAPPAEGAETPAPLADAAPAEGGAQ